MDQELTTPLLKQVKNTIKTIVASIVGVGDFMAFSGGDKITE
jgi:hypothetical protein